MKPLFALLWLIAISLQAQGVLDQTSEAVMQDFGKGTMVEDEVEDEIADFYHLNLKEMEVLSYVNAPYQLSVTYHQGKVFLLNCRKLEDEDFKVEETNEFLKWSHPDYLRLADASEILVERHPKFVSVLSPSAVQHLKALSSQPNIEVEIQGKKLSHVRWDWVTRSKLRLKHDAGELVLPIREIPESFLIQNKILPYDFQSMGVYLNFLYFEATSSFNAKLTRVAEFQNARYKVEFGYWDGQYRFKVKSEESKKSEGLAQGQNNISKNFNAPASVETDFKFSNLDAVILGTEQFLKHAFLAEQRRKLVYKRDLTRLVLEKGMDQFIWNADHGAKTIHSFQSVAHAEIFMMIKDDLRKTRSAYDSFIIKLYQSHLKDL